MTNPYQSPAPLRNDPTGVCQFFSDYGIDIVTRGDQAVVDGHTKAEYIREFIIKRRSPAIDIAFIDVQEVDDFDGDYLVDFRAGLPKDVRRESVYEQPELDDWVTMEDFPDKKAYWDTGVEPEMIASVVGDWQTVFQAAEKFTHFNSRMARLGYHRPAIHEARRSNRIDMGAFGVPQIPEPDLWDGKEDHPTISVETLAKHSHYSEDKRIEKAKDNLDEWRRK